MLQVNVLSCRILSFVTILFNVVQYSDRIKINERRFLCEFSCTFLHDMFDRVKYISLKGTSFTLLVNIYLCIKDQIFSYLNLRSACCADVFYLANGRESNQSHSSIPRFHNIKAFTFASGWLWGLQKLGSVLG